MLFLKSRSLQPILSQPVEEVLTYEALRYVHLYANTHTHTHIKNKYLDRCYHPPLLQVGLV